MNAKISALVCLIGGTLMGTWVGYRFGAAPKWHEVTVGGGTAIEGKTTGREGAVGPLGVKSVVPTPVGDSPRVVALWVRQAYLSSSKSGIRAAAIASALVGLPPDQISTLCEMLRLEMNTRNGYTLVYALMPIWADQDPVAALEFAQSLGTATRRNSATTSVLNRWLHRDSEAAVAHVRSLVKGEARIAMATAIVAELTIIDLPRAFAFMKEEGIENTNLKSEDLISLFFKWGEQDPATAADVALKLAPGKQRRLAISTLAGSWAKHDAEAAYRFLQGLDETAEKRTTIFAVFRSIAEADPVRASRLALALDGAERESAVSVVAKSWADQDLKRALAWVQDLPASRTKTTVMASLGRRWAAADPAGAAEFVAQMSPGTIRDNFTVEVAAAWGRSDADAALGWLRELPSGSSTSLAMSAIMEHMVSTGRAEAVAGLLLETPDNLALSRLYGQVADQWAAENMVAAKEWAKSLPPSQGRGDALKSILKHELRNDPAKAAEFAVGFSDDIGRPLIETVAAEWVQSDPAATWSWINTLPEGALRDDAVASMASQWGRDDPDAAIAWINGLEEGRQRDQFVDSMISGLAVSSAEAAATLVSRLPSGAELDKYAAKVVGAWAHSDPEAAAAWVTHFPEGEARTEGLASLVGMWSASDVTAASGFLGRLPEGASRTQAIESFVRANEKNYPAIAAQWVSELPPNARTTHKIERVALQWLLSDRPAAEAWLRQTPLSEARKALLLEQSARK